MRNSFLFTFIFNMPKHTTNVGQFPVYLIIFYTHSMSRSFHNYKEGCFISFLSLNNKYSQQQFLKISIVQLLESIEI
jgi:hypothetical protein